MQACDADDRVRVPPDAPAYDLQRIWLTDEEEQRYYGGFSNEGLWPLCHIVHVRPMFRAEDWAAYQTVNRRFAEAVAAEPRRRRDARCSSRTTTSRSWPASCAG